MKLTTYEDRGQVYAGVIIGDHVMDLQSLSPSLPTTLEALLEAGEPAMAKLRAAVASVTTPSGSPVGDVRLLAPICHPRKFLAMGLNYQSHVEEYRQRDGTEPDLTHQIWFNKQTSCINGPYDPIHLPFVSEQLDFEGELAIVIGRRCRHVPREQAMSVIAGYMIANDVSVRDWQKRTPTATLGKSFDTHGPTGPWLTTADEIADPHVLSVRSFVDGVLMQDGNTAEMVHQIDAMIAYLSTVMTLEPGDILATGTPAGMAMGRTPPPWLRAGQSVRIEIEQLGHLDNDVIAEPLP